MPVDGFDFADEISIIVLYLCFGLRVARYAVILAFDVKVERESQELADSLGVRIFSAEIIYHLFDAFTKYREDYKKAKQDEFK